jgi:hypothetical protein
MKPRHRRLVERPPQRDWSRPRGFSELLIAPCH